MVAVTIIMPVYNKEYYLNESIQSVLNQSFKDFELLIINDGSTDRSEEIIQRFKLQDSRIKYFKQQNKGVAVARNTGISMATGEYIAFLDADDLYKEYFLEKMLQVIKGHNVAICSSLNFTLNNKLKAVKWKCRGGDILTDYIYNRCVPNTNSWLLKRNFIIKNKLCFPIGMNWGEDQSFFIKVLCHEKNVQYVSEALTIYRTDVPLALSTNSLNKLYKDINWLEECKQYIQTQVKEHKRRTESLYAIDTYKLPALLIYRLVMNKNIVEKKIYEESYNQVKAYINQFKFSNSLRSIKLYLAKLQL